MSRILKFDIQVLSDGTPYIRMRDFDDPAVWRVECVTVNGWDGLRTELEDYGHDAAAIDRIFREIKANKSSAWFEY